MRKVFPLLCILLLLPVKHAAQEYPSSPSNYITDPYSYLSAGQQQSLNAKLKAFEDSTSSQIFVYLTGSLKGRAMSELCQEIFHTWQIGAKGKNNGILIGVFVEDHKFRIHTGHGLEGALPDILTKKIQDEDMKPWFKQDDYYMGLEKGIEKLMYFSKHEYRAEAGSAGPDSPWLSWLMAFGPNTVLLAVILYQASRRSAEYKRWPEGKKKKKRRNSIRLRLIASVVLSFIPCIGAIGLFFLLGSFVNIKSAGGRSGRRNDSGSSSSSSFGGGSSWSSSSDSGSSFSGGGGGDSGGGGSDSSW